MNDPADSFYIIKEGVVSCVDQDGKEVRTLGKNESFGENALYAEH